MAIMEFTPRNPIKPLFGIKLAPVLQRICEDFEIEDAEALLVDALKVDTNRLIQLKRVEDASGNFGMVLVIYDFIYKTKKPLISLPEKDGFFDFKIYELDFNKDIDIEWLIDQSKK